ATALLPDAPPPERVEAVLRGREAAARLLWNPAHQYRKLTERLWRIQVPTLVVWGADDRLVPLAYGEAWARRIRGGRPGGAPPPPPARTPRPPARPRPPPPRRGAAPPCSSSASTSCRGRTCRPTSSSGTTRRG